MEVVGHVDLTALAFGIVHIDPGFVLHPVIRESGWVPTVTVGASLHLLTNFQDVRGIPDLKFLTPLAGVQNSDPGRQFQFGARLIF